MIYLAHETNPNNPGDTSCCPINYFNLENLSKVFKITELKNINFEAKDIIIIGGGGILNDMYIPILNKISLTANNLVFWGIGTNRHFWPGRINSPMKENFCRSKFYLKEKDIFQKNEKNNNDLFFKPIDISDNTIPNGNPIMLINLIRLGYNDETKKLASSLNGYLNIYKNHMMTSVRALDFFNNVNSGKNCNEQGCKIND